MLKYNLPGLGGLLATVVVLGACGDGEIGDSVGEARGGPEPSVLDAGVELNPEAGGEFGEGGAPALPPPPGDARGRGPTGQWPSGFPAYTDTAEVVTNGTSAGLSAAINDATCSDGCVIEHAGSPSGTFSSRASGSGGIVVRPPIGERGDYTLGSTTIRVDALLFAGYAGGTGQLLVEDNGSNGKGSGFAWTDFSNPGGRLVVYCNRGARSKGLFYELVYRQYMSIPSDDRGGTRGEAGICNMEVVGSVIAGDPSPAPSAHADSFQNYNPGGETNISIRDSVVWSSWDKCFQNETGDDPIMIDNVFMMDPSNSQALWAGPPIGGSLGGYFHTTADAVITNSTVLGSAHSDRTAIGDSELHRANSNHTDLGGNTTLASRPTPPATPTPAQLDSIWAP